MDSVPTNANVVRAESLDVKPMNAKTIDRKIIKSHMGADPKITASFDATIDIEIALAIGGDANGVPTPGTTPQWDGLLRGCGVAKTTSATAITGTAQGGNLNAIKLASGASSTDDAYFGLTLAVEQISGAAQAPGSSAKNLFKLVATDKEHGGTLEAGSTDTLLNFASTASDDDGDYVGLTVTVASDSAVISDYNGTTKVATLATPLAGGAPGTVTYTVQRADNYYVDMLARITHFTGTIVSAGSYVSTTTKIFLPLSVVGTSNLQGCDLKITTGAAAAEIRRIKSYNVSTRMATLQSAIGTTPTSSSTFVVSEAKKVIASSGSTKIVTLKSALKFVTVSTTPYTLSVYRQCIGYDGTTKLATVAIPFRKAPTAVTTYVINPYVKYYPVSTGHISGSSYYYEDGALHAFSYAKANATMDFSAGALPMLKLSGMALVERYEDASFPTYDTSAWVEPLPVNFANTSAPHIHGFSDTTMDKFTFDMGNELVHLDQPGKEMIYIKDRVSKGSLSIWKPLSSQFDVYAAVRDNDTGVFGFTHGPVGNQIAFISKKVGLSNPAEGAKDGIKTIGMELGFIPTGAGSNDWALILQ